MTSFGQLTDREVANVLAKRLQRWRIDLKGAAISAADLSKRSGMGLTPLRRFEKTGGITLRNLIALMRAMGLLDRLEALIPDPATPSPMDILQAEQKKHIRRRAPRRKTGSRPHG